MIASCSRLCTDQTHKGISRDRQLFVSVCVYLLGLNVEHALLKLT